MSTDVNRNNISNSVLLSAVTSHINWNESLPPNNGDYVDYDRTDYGGYGAGPPMPDQELLRLQYVVRFFQMHYTPAVAILGLLGNTVSLVTLSHSALRKVSANQYLVGILLAETVYLFTLLHAWLNEHRITFYSIGGWCQFVTFAERVSSFLAMWYTVGLSVDGFIRVCFSDLEFRMCTVWRSRIFMIGAAILAIIVYLNTSITVAVTYYGSIPMCHDLPMFASHLVTLNRIDVFINCLIPYLTIVVMVTLMCVRLGVTYRRERSALRNTSRTRVNRTISSTSSSGSRTATSNRVVDIVDEDNPPSYFIIVFILIFLLLNLPKQTMHIYITFKTFVWKVPQTTLKEFLVQELLKQFIKTKSVVCFVVTVALHTAFRKVIWDRLCKCSSLLTSCNKSTGHQTPVSDSESYPLRGQSSQGANNTASDTHTSTSFLCDIEVRQQGTT